MKYTDISETCFRSCSCSAGLAMCFVWEAGYISSAFQTIQKKKKRKERKQPKKQPKKLKINWIKNLSLKFCRDLPKNLWKLQFDYDKSPQPKRIQNMHLQLKWEQLTWTLFSRSASWFDKNSRSRLSDSSRICSICSRSSVISTSNVSSRKRC